jgi:hypothetical protein
MWDPKRNRSRSIFRDMDPQHGLKFTTIYVLLNQNEKFFSKMVFNVAFCGPV